MQTYACFSVHLKGRHGESGKGGIPMEMTITDIATISDCNKYGRWRKWSVFPNSYHQIRVWHLSSRTMVKKPSLTNINFIYYLEHMYMSNRSYDLFHFKYYWEGKWKFLSSCNKKKQKDQIEQKRITDV